MAQVTLSVEADVATWSSGIAAGAGNHLPIGGYGGADYRSAMRFPIPAGWADWDIVSATLKVFISDHQHVAPKSSNIFCSRMNVAGLWTKAAGTQSCESGFTGGNNTQYGDIQSVSTDRVSWSSGSTANAEKSITVTGAVRYYQQNGATKIVFVFDNNGSDQYTELWADEKSGYNAELIISYNPAVAPGQPTLNSPAAGVTVLDQTPTFSWTPTGPTVQTEADVQVYDSTGVALPGGPIHVTGSALTVDQPTPLTRGLTYRWAVRTRNATGWGPFSAQRTFTVQANPVVTIVATREMVFANGGPRLLVRWGVTGGTQTGYEVTAPGYTSGPKTGAPGSFVCDGLALANGTPVTVTVTVTTADGLTGVGSQAFTPRFGLTTHRKDMGVDAPTVIKNWLTPNVAPVGTPPAGANLQPEYAATDTTAAPTTWYTSMSDVGKLRYLWWRVWFIPNATAGPVLDSVSIPYDGATASVDKWGIVRNVIGLGSGWSVDTGEYVYGSRSIAVEPAGVATYCYSFKVNLKKDRRYIVTGLMKSKGASNGCIELQSKTGTVLLGGGVLLPADSDMRTKEMDDPLGTPWFSSSGHDAYDVIRYSTPVYEAKEDDEEVYVVLKASGPSGTKAWFDAIKLEESTVATPWSPGAVGATIIDAGGVQVDGSRGGVFRYRGTADPVTNPRALVEGGANGLKFGGDTELASPATGLLAVNGVLLGSSGGAFPSSPAPNDRWFRTDLGIEFYWDGSRWLSTTLYEQALPVVVGQASDIGDPQGRAPTPSLRGGSDIWLVSANLSGFKVNGGTALSASHKWTVNFNGGGPGGIVGHASFVIDSGLSNNVWRVGTPGPLAAMNRVLGTLYHSYFYIHTGKTGTPGPIDVALTVLYRIVG